MHDIIDRIKLTMEYDVVNRLLAGNDTQCFTTEQYADARDAWIADMCGKTREQLLLPKAPIEYARKQLDAFPLVAQVSQDVWTLKELVNREVSNA